MGMDEYGAWWKFLSNHIQRLKVLKG